MTNRIRVALPGYNALTDTDPDHFALYSDEDWVLIKEKTRGSFSGDATPNPYVITHNLGYVPFFLVFVYDHIGYFMTAGTWRQVGNGNISIWVASFSDTTKLTIAQDGDVDTKFIYYIFYDNIVGSSSNTITESKKVFKVAKQGVNALTSKDPNDYIFHSDLNTFKIIKEGTTTINKTTNGNYSFDHNAGISTPAAFMLFVKFPDGSTTMGNGTFSSQSRDGNWQLAAGITTTQIICNLYNSGGSSGTFNIKYYIFETPLT